jgi:alanyl-tRNA synthetase
MTVNQIRAKFLEFYKKRGHAIIPSAPLVPENDPTTLFTSSGMQPLVPYLLGQPHPLGKRIADSQKSFRAQDIEEVGDNRHTTFFEMLGNWSLGDYFKKEQLPWVFEFFTKELGLDPKRLYVTIYKGNGSISKDADSIAIWKDIFSSVGIEANEGERIFSYADNWWSRSGIPEKMPPGEPGGPDSEIFYDFGDELGLHEKSPFKKETCHPNCDCGRFLEIGNSVFMQYQKLADGSLKELPQKNVDFGGGLERINAAVHNKPDIFLTDSFLPIVRMIELLSTRSYGQKIEETRAMRIIADHVRGAVMMMSDGVVPSNKAQGYVLRRLLRRSLIYGKSLGLWGNWEYMGRLVAPIIHMFEDVYPEIKVKEQSITKTIVDEAERFGKTVEKGLKEIEKMETIDGRQAVPDGRQAFILYETYGFPWELTEEIVVNKGRTIDKKQFEQEFKKHQDLSRSAASGMFKGGLVEHSVETTKLHTATHLLHQALRMVLGNHVSQKGSNITVERLRFDFSHPTKVTPEELKKIEDIVNEQIQNNLKVTMEEMDKEKALKSGALGFFVEKYGDRVKVYSAGPSAGASTELSRTSSGLKPFSMEICGGPHVGFTGELGHFTIMKEEAVSAGIRRIYASCHREP